MNQKAFNAKIEVYDKEIDRLKSALKPTMTIFQKKIINDRINTIEEAKKQFSDAVYEADSAEMERYLAMVEKDRAKYCR